MADFTSDFQSFKPPFPFFDNIDPNMEAVMNQFAVLHPSLMEASSMNLHSFVGFSNENFFNPQQQQQHVAEFPGNLLENFPGIFHHDEKNVILLPQAPISPAALSTGNGNCFNTDSKKRKLMELSESTSGNSSHISEIGIERKNSSGKGKKIKANQKEQGLPKEVVHVRARRGQATDSHSLAERVRRGKINERLRCLQDIVPGCYKTMGMAVMLDEIINYVQSLQNQVEFLSMKLTAASTFYDFNSDTDALEALQRAKANEAQKVQRVMGEGYEEEVGSTQLGPLDLTFGTYPSLPYNTS